MAVRQEVKSIDNSVVVPELELAINMTYRVIYEVKVRKKAKIRNRYN